MTYENILVEQRGAVTLITLNRPKALNALNTAVLAEVITAFAGYDADDGQRCAVVDGVASLSICAEKGAINDAVPERTVVPMAERAPTMLLSR